MAEIKLTKNELRIQQKHLGQLERYLPILQLKKAMLQAEVYEAQNEIKRMIDILNGSSAHVQSFSSLLTIDAAEVARVLKIHKKFENVAGIEVPVFDRITFVKFEYSLFDSPPWLEGAIEGLRALEEAKARVLIAEEKKSALENELRQVSIRVNLFEKNLIPRAFRNIKKIRIFLGDQELAAVGRAKVAKGKIAL